MIYDETVDKIVDIIYAQLLAMATGGTLVPGQKYRITDRNNLLVVALTSTQWVPADQGGIILQNQVFS